MSEIIGNVDKEFEKDKNPIKLTTFKPVPIPKITTKPEEGSDQATATVTLKGEAATLFKKMVEENGLNHSFLAKQMIYHCLGLEDRLEALTKQAAIWGIRK